MFTKLKQIALSQEELNALMKLSEQEIRAIDDQARFIIRAELERRGFITNSQQQLQESEVKANEC